MSHNRPPPLVSAPNIVTYIREFGMLREILHCDLSGHCAKHVLHDLVTKQEKKFKLPFYAEPSKVALQFSEITYFITDYYF